MLTNVDVLTTQKRYILYAPYCIKNKINSLKLTQNYFVNICSEYYKSEYCKVVDILDI